MARGGCDMTGGLKISATVWRRCDKELQLYPLRKARVQEARALAYQEGWGSWPTLAWGSELAAQDRDSFMPGGGGSIYKSTLDAQLARLMSNDIAGDERIISAIDDVVDGLRGTHRQFFRLYYDKGLTMVECADHMALTRRQVTRYKHEIIERTAFRLWLL
jgi:predicted DNA-binding protein YlxM (UPF0122 family)